MKISHFHIGMPYLCLAKKILLVMKITTFFLLITIMQVSASTFAQNINLSESNAPLEKIFKEIGIQTGYSFVFTDGELKDTKLVSIHVSSATIKDVLDQIFANQPLTYTIKDVTIVVKEKELTIPDKIKAALSNITGKITDEAGQPLPGVTVFDKTYKKGTVTQLDGTYSISANKGDVLVFRFIGYKTKEIFVADQPVINISMTKTVSSLEDVVVIGYGTTKREDLTGSVSTVAAKDIENVPFNTVDNALAGKAAGVQVTKSDGTPGGAVRIRIRGSSSLLGGNDPLYVIDGVPIQVQSNFISPGYDLRNPAGNDVTGGLGGASNTSLSSSFVNGLNSLGGLNPDDIESITILKDASSTGIYGSKAANGVVIITTKRGKKDMAPQITTSYYSTVSSPKTANVLDASQYKSLITESARNDFNERTANRLTIPINLTQILNNPSTFFGPANTNWIKEVTRTAVSNNAELSVQGGGNNSKYFSSISYNNTPGVVDATNYQRVSGKINLENDIAKHFRFITNIIMGYTNQDIGDGAYAQAVRARPDLAPYDANGNLTNFSVAGQPFFGFQNPLALLKATNNAKTFSLLGSISGIYDITSQLEFKSTVSLNSQTYNQRNFAPSFLGLGSSNLSTDGGIGSNSNSRLTDWFVENTLSYTKTFNTKHAIDLLAGTSYETRKTSFFSATATGYPNDNVLTSLSSAVTPLIVTGDDPSQPQSYLLSFYLRANYSYLDRYLFTFTGRTDGSSKFGPDNKFGYFPSGAVAWRISKEDFLKNITWIDDIKFRGSYGLTGTQNIGDQKYRTLFSPFSYDGTSALVPTQDGNPSIKWESTREADGGLDISLFNDRLQATFDYYNKQTNGALLSLPVATSSSYSSLLRNAVSIKNTGVEVSLSGDIIRTKDFKWSASVNVTWNNSVVTKLDRNADLTQIGNITGLEYQNTILELGKPLGLITGRKVTGIIENQAELDAYKKRLGRFASRTPTLNIGDPIYALNNENSATGSSPNYYSIIGNAAPKYFGGFTQGFKYKKFDLEFYFTFSQGGELFWGDHVSSVEFVGTSNANVSILNRYTPQNPNTGLPRLLLDDPNYTKSNLDLFSSSYIKLRTLTLNYHFDKSKWMDKAGLHNVSLFASAANVFTITKYPGNDPETSDDPYSVSGGYFDTSNYPTIRSFSIGIKAGF
jgi:TonB-linked SusC/RagA family outer membrane protein